MPPTCTQIFDVCLTQSEIAAWVQAISAILAVIIAFGTPAYVAYRETRRARRLDAQGVRNDYLRSRGKALSILNDIEHLRSGGQAAPRMKSSRNPWESAAAIRNWAGQTELMERISAVSFDLGSATAPVQEMLFNLRRAHRAALSIERTFPTLSPDYGSVRELLDQSVELVIESANEAIASIDAMFDG